MKMMSRFLIAMLVMIPVLGLSTPVKATHVISIYNSMDIFNAMSDIASSSTGDDVTLLIGTSFTHDGGMSLGGSGRTITIDLGDNTFNIISSGTANALAIAGGVTVHIEGTGTMNVESDMGIGLTVATSGTLLNLAPTATLNATSNLNNGATVTTGSTATVTNVTGHNFAASALDTGSTLHVRGNATATNSHAARAFNGGTLIVHGTVTTYGNDAVAVSATGVPSSSITINGNVSALGTNGGGVNVGANSTVTLNGTLSAARPIIFPDEDRGFGDFDSTDSSHRIFSGPGNRVVRLYGLPPVIDSANSATFTEETAGSFTVTAANNPDYFTIVGALPNGVTFNTSTGVLSGTPAEGTAGTYNIVFTATNVFWESVAQNFTLTVAGDAPPPPPPLPSPSPPPPPPPTNDNGGESDAPSTEDAREVVINASITPNRATFNIHTDTYISVRLNRRGHTLQSLRFGRTSLVRGTDYTVNGDIFTISEEFLQGLNLGRNNITFIMSGGGNPRLQITVIDEVEYYIEYEPYTPYEPEPEPVALLRLTIGSYTYVKNEILRQSDAAPFIDPAYGRTMVPLRIIAEALGKEVAWNPYTRTVTIFTDTSQLSLTIGEPLPGGMGVPVIVNDRTFVPLRYVSEMLGAVVEWDAVNKEVRVYHELMDFN